MKLKNLFYAILVALALTACGGGGDGGDAPPNVGSDVVVGENTRVLTDNTLVNDLQSVSEDGNTLTFSATSAEAQELNVGDVIVAGYSEVTPQGFMKIITAKTMAARSVTGQPIVLETEPAALADVFEKASFSVSEVLTHEGNGTVITDIADGVTFDDQTTTDRMVIDLVRKKFKLDVPLLGTENAGIKVVGTYEPTLSVDLDWDIDGHSLEMLKFVPQLSGSLEAKIVTSIATDDNDLIVRKQLFSIEKTQWYLVGYVPVCVTYKVPIYLTFKGKAEVGIEAGVAAGLTIKSGFLYEKDHDISLISDIIPEADWIYPTVYGEFTGNFGPSVGAGITLYGTASITAILDEGVKLQLKPELSMDPCAGARLLFESSLFTSGSVRVDFTVFDRTLLAKEFPLLRETEYLPHTTTLAQSNENPVPAIEFPDTGELYAGTPVQFTSDSTDANGTVVSYLWDFGDGTTSTSSLPTHIYQNVGRYNFSLTVEDNNGCSVTDNMYVDINPVVIPVEHGTVAGAVKDAVIGGPLSGVSVAASLDGSTVDTITTDASGNYSLSLPEANGYSFQFTRTGYLPATYSNIDVAGNDSSYLEAILQIDNAHAGVGEIGGIITNALTGEGLSDVEVTLRQGINVISGAIIASAQTGASGTYIINNLAAGQYTAQLSRSGYSTTYVTVICLGNTSNANQNGSITPILSADELRVVLTWGDSPYDLDSHLTLPDGESRFHLYYINKGTVHTIDGLETCILDTDDVSSYGPETITLFRTVNGVVRYSVHDFSNRGSSSSTALASSGAKVEIYRGSALVARFNVPNQAGTLWTVFELENGQIRSVNSLSYESYSSNVRSLISGAPLVNDAELIRTQIGK
jgi:PKD repeat protein